MQIPEEVVEEILDSWPVARLATVGPDGAPHLVPVVFVRVEGALWSPVDGKPKTSAVLARVRNVERDPRISLLVDHYDEDWSRLWWIRIEGNARVVRSDDPDSDPVVAPVAGHLREKYDGYRDVPVLASPPTLIRVEPARTRTWCASRTALEGSR
jgi:PPOX class probable F420-dependent enzyme